MDDLPELPFEQILSHLSLDDLLKSRAVLRGWCHRIDSYRVKCLCFSRHPSGFIEGKSRWVSGAFAQNFISSTRFVSFFATFGQTILSNLKLLRLCDLELNEENQTAFARTLNSFGRLKELDLIRFDYSYADFKQKMDLELNLPMLNSIRLEACRIEKLTLNAPKLKKVKLTFCYFLNLDLVHAESVERLITDRLKYTEVKNLKNLKYLHQGCQPIDSRWLSSMEQLKEIHLLRNVNRYDVIKIFSQKQRNGCAELKIYIKGLLLSSPDDLAFDSPFDFFEKEVFRYCSENASRLADEIPFRNMLSYMAIEQVAPGSEINLLKRFIDLKKIWVIRSVQDIDLKKIWVIRSVQDIERFLDLLKNFGNIANLWFFNDQPQALFDRLPEHSAVQCLTIHRAPSDLRFLFRLKHLIRLRLECSIDAEWIWKVFEELQFLSEFQFQCNYKSAEIRIEHPKRFWVSIDRKELVNVADLNAAIQLVTGNAP